MTVIGTAGFPIASVFGSRLVYAAGAGREDGIRPSGKVRARGERGRDAAQLGRTDAEGPHLSAERGGAVPNRARSARRRLERERPHRGGADGPRHCEQRRARGCHRYDVGQGGSVPGLRSGCKLRRALAEIESGYMEWRSVKARHLWKLERRPGRGTPGHAPARSALQRHSASRSAACRRHRGLRRDALARQRSARALQECGEAEARQP